VRMRGQTARGNVNAAPRIILVRDAARFEGDARLEGDAQGTPNALRDRTRSVTVTVTTEWFRARATNIFPMPQKPCALAWTTGVFRGLLVRSHALS